jgi:hypothetical protein
LAHEEQDLDPFSIRTSKTKTHKAAEAAARKARTEGAGMFFALPAPVLWTVSRFGGRDYSRRIAPIWP